MSASKNVTLWCDFPNCLQHWEGGGASGHSVSQTRLEARSYGWRYRDGKDTCKTHSIFKPREWRAIE